MTKILKHIGFAHQVVMEGSTIICMVEEDEAAEYCQEKFKGASYVILPVPLFKYVEESS